MQASTSGRFFSVLSGTFIKEKIVLKYFIHLKCIYRPKHKLFRDEAAWHNSVAFSNSM